MTRGGERLLCETKVVSLADYCVGFERPAVTWGLRIVLSQKRSKVLDRQVLEAGWAGPLVSLLRIQARHRMSIVTRFAFKRLRSQGIKPSRRMFFAQQADKPVATALHLVTRRPPCLAGSSRNPAERPARPV